MMSSESAHVIYTDVFQLGTGSELEVSASSRGEDLASRIVVPKHSPSHHLIKEKGSEPAVLLRLVKERSENGPCTRSVLVPAKALADILNQRETFDKVVNASSSSGNQRSKVRRVEPTKREFTFYDCGRHILRVSFDNLAFQRTNIHIRWWTLDGNTNALLPGAGICFDYGFFGTFRSSIIGNLNDFLSQCEELEQSPALNFYTDG